VWVVPAEEQDQLKEGPSTTKSQIRQDFWRAFVTYGQHGMRRYYDPAANQVVDLADGVDHPQIPEIVPFTQEQQLQWRREFAQNVEDPGQRGEIQSSLSAEQPLREFSSYLRSKPDIKKQWNLFLFRKVQAGIEAWAKRNSVAPGIWPQRSSSAEVLDRKRRELYSVLDKIPVDLLLDLQIPLRWLVERQDKN